MMSMHELSISMSEPMLSLSMLIFAKSGQASRSKAWLDRTGQGAQGRTSPWTGLRFQKDSCQANEGQGHPKELSLYPTSSLL